MISFVIFENSSDNMSRITLVLRYMAHQCSLDKYFLIFVISAPKVV